MMRGFSARVFALVFVLVLAALALVRAGTLPSVGGALLVALLISIAAGSWAARSFPGAVSIPPGGTADTAEIRALREDRDLLEGILDTMREGVLRLDGRGRIALANPALREMFLLPPEVRGRPLLDVIRNGELKALLDRAAAGGSPATAEIATLGLRPRTLEAWAAPAGGATGGLVAVLVDVTETRRLEGVRADFIANASHELRTPVATLRSAAEDLGVMLERRPAEAAALVGIVERNAVRLQHLVEDLLDLSRIESRRIQLVLEPVDLHAAGEQAVTLYRSAAEAKGIRLTNEIPPTLVAPRADRRALEHILANLVDNAVKYSPPASQVRILARREEGALRVSVRDTGPGIEPKHLPRLFERFYRVDPGRSRELGGTGLGLSIVKHLAEAMGGRAGVESRPGAGSTFSFTLPGEPDPRGAPAQPSSTNG